MNLTRRLLVTCAAAAIVCGAGSTAVAGGWALTTLDETPVPVAGESVDVGFTIRQHGVTPVALGEHDGDVGIEIVDGAGQVTFFAAVPDGLVGHYVATVTFPEAGTFEWSARQGWFAPQELGTITVGSATAGSGGWSPAVPSPVTWLAVAAVACAAVAIVDLVVSRRRSAPA